MAFLAAVAKLVMYDLISGSVRACGTGIGLAESGIGEAETSGKLFSFARASGDAVLPKARI
jgi:hypothetical protein